MRLLINFILAPRYLFYWWNLRRKLVKDGTLVKMNSKRGKEILLATTKEGVIGKIEGFRVIETKKKL